MSRTGDVMLRFAQSSKIHRSGGFTLVEVIITAGVLAVSLPAIVYLFTCCLWEAEFSGNLSIATSQAYGKAEEIRNLDIRSLAATYGREGITGTTFPVEQPEGKGVVYASAINSSLMEVEVIICWRERGTVIGEDQNLNGVLDQGEDGNANGRLDSPAAVATLIGSR
jgi:hypothetical protein